MPASHCAAGGARLQAASAPAPQGLVGAQLALDQAKLKLKLLRRASSSLRSSADNSRAAMTASVAGVADETSCSRPHPLAAPAPLSRYWVWQPEGWKTTSGQRIFWQWKSLSNLLY
jgi:hypothetical protein